MQALRCMHRKGHKMLMGWPGNYCYYTFPWASPDLHCRRMANIKITCHLYYEDDLRIILNCYWKLSTTVLVIIIP